MNRAITPCQPPRIPGNALRNHVVPVEQVKLPHSEQNINSSSNICISTRTAGLLLVKILEPLLAFCPQDLCLMSLSLLTVSFIQRDFLVKICLIKYYV